MARPGYKEARAAVDKALLNRNQMRIELDNIEALELPESLKIARRGDWQRGLDQAEIELTVAEAAFAKFTDKPPSAPRSYFDMQINVALSLTSGMYMSALQRQQKEGIRMPELVRRALAVYLKNETIGTKEN